MLSRYRLDPQQKCSKLSKGQAAKLSLLHALAHAPPILILDEPTDGLDPIARDEFLEQVLDAAVQSPRTVLISSHALADLQRIDASPTRAKGSSPARCGAHVHSGTAPTSWSIC